MGRETHNPYVDHAVFHGPHGTKPWEPRFCSTPDPCHGSRVPSLRRLWLHPLLRQRSGLRVNPLSQRRIPATPSSFEAGKARETPTHRPAPTLHASNRRGQRWGRAPPAPAQQHLPALLPTPQNQDTPKIRRACAEAAPPPPA